MPSYSRTSIHCVLMRNLLEWPLTIILSLFLNSSPKTIQNYIEIYCSCICKHYSDFISIFAQKKTNDNTVKLWKASFHRSQQMDEWLHFTFFPLFFFLFLFLFHFWCERSNRISIIWFSMFTSFPIVIVIMIVIIEIIIIVRCCNDSVIISIAENR